MAFDSAYYQRFYVDARTAVSSLAEVRARAQLIVAGVNYLGVPVRSILDAGCGLGLLRAPLRRALPRASYTGYELSDYLCRRYGWTRGSLQTLSVRRKYDLVVCYDVLQYLERAAAAEAIARLGRVCRGLLYFGALTLEDWRENCDQSRTDPIRRLRTGRWYRRELQRSFRPMGCGLWLRRNLDLATWNLDQAA